MYSETLETEHNRIKTACVNEFNSSCMGTPPIKRDNEHDLQQKIDATYDDIKKRNQTRIHITTAAVAAVGAAGAVGVLGVVALYGGAIVGSVLIGVVSLASRLR